ncbi:hypothetical protein [Sinorhizobium fredii]|uniref:hypothetical protein n=1 Tax=Rhizobium fredii TaxID=380 RepID=UPI0004BAA46C|nr:hypothetical protein [Sinorhizobium fredii]
MEREELFEIQAQLDGLRLVLNIALDLVPNQREVLERLKATEAGLREQSMLAGTIEVVRSYREIWEKSSRA